VLLFGSESNQAASELYGQGRIPVSRVLE
jgi:hypothetical protein